MPQSRHRKIERARKRPRVAPSNPGVVTRPPASKKNTQLLVIVIVAAVVAALTAAYFITSRRGATQAANQITTASGLKYEDTKVGDGASPKMGQTVRVNYLGRLKDENGREFNNTNGRPVEFGFGEVVPGWQEGLQSMKVGGKRRLWIPSKLAYGPAGRPPTIPPNSDLYFEIDLLGVK